MAEYTIGELQGIAAFGDLVKDWLESTIPERADAAELVLGDLRVPVYDRDGNNVASIITSDGDVTIEIKESK